MTKPAWVKTTVLTIALSLIFPYLTFAFEGTPYGPAKSSLAAVRHIGKNLQIPKDFGHIQSSFQGQGKTVICIQDLHCNQEVQLNIASMLRYLGHHHGLKLVGEEGASRPLDLAVLRDFPLEDTRSQVARHFVKQGKLTGAEYFAATGNPLIRLEGIEDRALYEQSLAAIHSFLTSETQGLLSDLFELLDACKPTVYSQKLIRHDQPCQAYRQGELDLLAYVGHLRKAAIRQAIDLGRFANVTAFLRSPARINLEGVDSDALFQELEQVDSLVRERLYANPAERELDTLQRRLEIMEKLLNISATPAEVERFRQQRSAFRLQPFSDFFQQHGLEAGFWSADFGNLEPALEAAERFYDLADLRSRRFVENLLGSMDKAGETLAVMINGGFHNPGILAELKRRGISYVAIQPRLTRQDVVNPYFSLLQGRKLPLEKLLEKYQSLMSVPAWPESTDFNRTLETLEKAVAMQRWPGLSEARQRQLQAFLAKHQATQLTALTPQELSEARLRVPQGILAGRLRVGAGRTELYLLVAEHAVVPESVRSKMAQVYENLGPWGIALFENETVLRQAGEALGQAFGLRDRAAAAPGVGAWRWMAAFFNTAFGVPRETYARVWAPLVEHPLSALLFGLTMGGLTYWWAGGSVFLTLNLGNLATWAGYYGLHRRSRPADSAAASRIAHANIALGLLVSVTALGLNALGFGPLSLAVQAGVTFGFSFLPHYAENRRWLNRLGAWGSRQYRALLSLGSSLQTTSPDWAAVSERLSALGLLATLAGLATFFYQVFRPGSQGPTLTLVILVIALANLRGWPILLRAILADRDAFDGQMKALGDRQHARSPKADQWLRQTSWEYLFLLMPVLNWFVGASMIGFILPELLYKWTFRQVLSAAKFARQHILTRGLPLTPEDLSQRMGISRSAAAWALEFLASREAAAWQLEGIERREDANGRVVYAPQLEIPVEAEAALDPYGEKLLTAAALLAGKGIVPELEYGGQGWLDPELKAWVQRTNFSIARRFHALAPAGRLAINSVPTVDDARRAAALGVRIFIPNQRWNAADIRRLKNEFPGSLILYPWSIQAVQWVVEDRADGVRLEAGQPAAHAQALLQEIRRHPGKFLGLETIYNQPHGLEKAKEVIALRQLEAAHEMIPEDRRPGPGYGGLIPWLREWFSARGGAGPELQIRRAAFYDRWGAAVLEMLVASPLAGFFYQAVLAPYFGRLNGPPRLAAILWGTALVESALGLGLWVWTGDATLAGQGVFGLLWPVYFGLHYLRATSSAPASLMNKLAAFAIMALNLSLLVFGNFSILEMMFFGATSHILAGFALRLIQPTATAPQFESSQPQAPEAAANMSSISRPGTPDDRPPFRSFQSMNRQLPALILDQLKLRGFEDRELKAASGLLSVIAGIYQRMDLSDRYFHNHAHNLSVIYTALLMIRGMDMTLGDVKKVFLAALLHDFHLRPAGQPVFVPETLRQVNAMLQWNWTEEAPQAPTYGQVMMEKDKAFLRRHFQNLLAGSTESQDIREIIALKQRTDFPSDVNTGLLSSEEKTWAGEIRQTLAGYTPATDLNALITELEGRVAGVADEGEKAAVWRRVLTIELSYARSLAALHMVHTAAGKPGRAAQVSQLAEILQAADIASYAVLVAPELEADQVIPGWAAEIGASDLGVSGNYRDFRKPFLLENLPFMNLIAGLPEEHRKNFLEGCEFFALRGGPEVFHDWQENKARYSGQLLVDPGQVGMASAQDRRLIPQVAASYMETAQRLEQLTTSMGLLPDWISEKEALLAKARFCRRLLTEPESWNQASALLAKLEQEFSPVGRLPGRQAEMAAAMQTILEANPGDFGHWLLAGEIVARHQKALPLPLSENEADQERRDEAYYFSERLGQVGQAQAVDEFAAKWTRIVWEMEKVNAVKDAAARAEEERARVNALLLNYLEVGLVHYFRNQLMKMGGFLKRILTRERNNPYLSEVMNGVTRREKVEKTLEDLEKVFGEPMKEMLAVYVPRLLEPSPEDVFMAKSLHDQDAGRRLEAIGLQHLAKRRGDETLSPREMVLHQFLNEFYRNVGKPLDEINTIMGEFYGQHDASLDRDITIVREVMALYEAVNQEIREILDFRRIPALSTINFSSALELALQTLGVVGSRWQETPGGRELALTLRRSEIWKNASSQDTKTTRVRVVNRLPEAPLHVNKSQLATILAKLIRNAVMNGAADLSIDIAQVGSQLQITFEDDGETFDPEHAGWPLHVPFVQYKGKRLITNEYVLARQFVESVRGRVSLRQSGARGERTVLRMSLPLEFTPEGALAPISNKIRWLQLYDIAGKFAQAGSVEDVKRILENGLKEILGFGGMFNTYTLTKTGQTWYYQSASRFGMIGFSRALAWRAFDRVDEKASAIASGRALQVINNRLEDSRVNPAHLLYDFMNYGLRRYTAVLRLAGWLLRSRLGQLAVRPWLTRGLLRFLPADRMEGINQSLTLRLGVPGEDPLGMVFILFRRELQEEEVQILEALSQQTTLALQRIQRLDTLTQEWPKHEVQFTEAELSDLVMSMREALQEVNPRLHRWLADLEREGRHAEYDRLNDWRAAFRTSVARRFLEATAPAAQDAGQEPVLDTRNSEVFFKDYCYQVNRAKNIAQIEALARHAENWLLAQDLGDQNETESLLEALRRLSQIARQNIYLSEILQLVQPDQEPLETSLESLDDLMEAHPGLKTPELVKIRESLNNDLMIIRSLRGVKPAVRVFSDYSSQLLAARSFPEIWRQLRSVLTKYMPFAQITVHEARATGQDRLYLFTHSVTAETPGYWQNIEKSHGIHSMLSGQLKNPEGPAAAAAYQVGSYRAEEQEGQRPGIFPELNYLWVRHRHRAPFESQRAVLSDAIAYAGWPRWLKAGASWLTRSWPESAAAVATRVLAWIWPSAIRRVDEKLLLSAPSPEGRSSLVVEIRAWDPGKPAASLFASDEQREQQFRAFSMLFSETYDSLETVDQMQALTRSRIDLNLAIGQLRDLYRQNLALALKKILLQRGRFQDWLLGARTAAGSRAERQQLLNAIWELAKFLESLELVQDKFQHLLTPDLTEDLEAVNARNAAAAEEETQAILARIAGRAVQARPQELDEERTLYRFYYQLLGAPTLEETVRLAEDALEQVGPGRELRALMLSLTRSAVRQQISLRQLKGDNQRLAEGLVKIRAEYDLFFQVIGANLGHADLLGNFQPGWQELRQELAQIAAAENSVDSLLDTFQGALEKRGWHETNAAAVAVESRAGPDQAATRAYTAFYEALTADHKAAALVDFLQQDAHMARVAPELLEMKKISGGVAWGAPDYTLWDATLGMLRDLQLLAGDTHTLQTSRGWELLNPSQRQVLQTMYRQIQKEGGEEMLWFTVLLLLSGKAYALLPYVRRELSASRAYAIIGRYNEHMVGRFIDPDRVRKLLEAYSLLGDYWLREITRSELKRVLSGFRPAEINMLILLSFLIIKNVGPQGRLTPQFAAWALNRFSDGERVERWMDRDQAQAADGGQRIADWERRIQWWGIDRNLVEQMIPSSNRQRFQEWLDTVQLHNAYFNLTFLSSESGLKLLYMAFKWTNMASGARQVPWVVFNTDRNSLALERLLRDVPVQAIDQLDKDTVAGITQGLKSGNLVECGLLKDVWLSLEGPGDNKQLLIQLSLLNNNPEPAAEIAPARGGRSALLKRWSLRLLPGLSGAVYDRYVVLFETGWSLFLGATAWALLYGLAGWLALAVLGQPIDLVQYLQQWPLAEIVQRVLALALVVFPLAHLGPSTPWRNKLAAGFIAAVTGLLWLALPGQLSAFTQVFVVLAVYTGLHETVNRLLGWLQRRALEEHEPLVHAFSTFAEVLRFHLRSGAGLMIMILVSFNLMIYGLYKFVNAVGVMNLALVLGVAFAVIAAKHFYQSRLRPHLPPRWLDLIVHPWEWVLTAQSLYYRSRYGFEYRQVWNAWQTRLRTLRDIALPEIPEKPVSDFRIERFFQELKRRMDRVHKEPAPLLPEDTPTDEDEVERLSNILGFEDSGLDLTLRRVLGVLQQGYRPAEEDQKALNLWLLERGYYLWMDKPGELEYLRVAGPVENSGEVDGVPLHVVRFQRISRLQRGNNDLSRHLPDVHLGAVIVNGIDQATDMVWKAEGQDEVEQYLMSLSGRSRTRPEIQAHLEAFARARLRQEMVDYTLGMDILARNMPNHPPINASRYAAALTEAGTVYFGLSRLWANSATPGFSQLLARLSGIKELATEPREKDEWQAAMKQWVETFSDEEAMRLHVQSVLDGFVRENLSPLYRLRGHPELAMDRHTAARVKRTLPLGLFTAIGLAALAGLAFTAYWIGNALPPDLGITLGMAGMLTPPAGARERTWSEEERSRWLEEFKAIAEIHHRTMRGDFTALLQALANADLQTRVALAIAAAGVDSEIVQKFLKTDFRLDAKNPAHKIHIKEVILAGNQYNITFTMRHFEAWGLDKNDPLDRPLLLEIADGMISQDVTSALLSFAHLGFGFQTPEDRPIAEHYRLLFARNDPYVAAGSYRSFGLDRTVPKDRYFLFQYLLTCLGYCPPARLKSIIKSIDNPMIKNSFTAQDLAGFVEELTSRFPGVLIPLLEKYRYHQWSGKLYLQQTLTGKEAELANFFFMAAAQMTAAIAHSEELPENERPVYLENLQLLTRLFKRDEAASVTTEKLAVFLEVLGESKFSLQKKMLEKYLYMSLDDFVLLHWSAAGDEKVLDRLYQSAYQDNRFSRKGRDEYARLLIFFHQNETPPEVRRNILNRLSEIPYDRSHEFLAEAILLSMQPFDPAAITAEAKLMHYSRMARQKLRQAFELMIPANQIKTKYRRAFSSWASFVPIAVYAQKMQGLPDVRRAVNLFVRWLMEDEYRTRRYQWPHLARLPRSLLETWVQNRRILAGTLMHGVDDPETMPALEGLTVEDTDDPELMFTNPVDMKDEQDAKESCKSYYGDPRFTQTLINDALDGKIKVLLIRDRQGRILAKALLKLLQSSRDGRPVLLLNRVYRHRSLEIEPMRRLAMVYGLSLAKTLGIDLAFIGGHELYHDYDITKSRLGYFRLARAEEPLVSTGGAFVESKENPLPEYEDALGNRGNNTSVYEIPEGNTSIVAVADMLPAHLRTLPVILETEIGAPVDGQLISPWWEQYLPWVPSILRRPLETAFLAGGVILGVVVGGATVWFLGALTVVVFGGVFLYAHKEKGWGAGQWLAATAGVLGMALATFVFVHDLAAPHTWWTLATGTLPQNWIFNLMAPLVLGFAISDAIHGAYNRFQPRVTARFSQWYTDGLRTVLGMAGVRGRFTMPAVSAVFGPLLSWREVHQLAASRTQAVFMLKAYLDQHRLGPNDPLPVIARQAAALFKPNSGWQDHVGIRVAGSFRVGYETKREFDPTADAVGREDVVFVITIPWLLGGALTPASERRGLARLISPLQSRLVAGIVVWKLRQYRAETLVLKSSVARETETDAWEYGGEKILRLTPEGMRRLGGSTLEAFYRPTSQRIMGTAGAEIAKILAALAPEADLWAMLQAPLLALLPAGHAPSSGLLLEALLAAKVDPREPAASLLTGLQESLRQAQASGDRKRLAMEANHALDLILRSRRAPSWTPATLEQTTGAPGADPIRLILDPETKQAFREAARKLAVVSASPATAEQLRFIQALMDEGHGLELSARESQRLQGMLAALAPVDGQVAVARVGAELAQIPVQHAASLVNGRSETETFLHEGMEVEVSIPVVATLLTDRPDTWEAFEQASAAEREALQVIPYAGQLPQPLPASQAHAFERDLGRILSQELFFQARDRLGRTQALAQAYHQWQQKPSRVSRERVARVLIRMLAAEMHQREAAGQKIDRQPDLASALEAMDRVFRSSRLFSRPVEIGRMEGEPVVAAGDLRWGSMLRLIWLWSKHEGFVLNDRLEQKLREIRLRDFRISSAA